MPIAHLDTVDVAYELHEPAKTDAQGAETILMIQGLGMPLSGWPDEWLKLFTEAGYRVIIPDNRDIGKSSLFQTTQRPNMTWQWIKNLIGLKPTAPYTLSDMAKDSIALLDALDIDTVHVLGVSMGGMIAQLVAVHAPEKVKTLTSIMSTTGNRSLSKPTAEVVKHMMMGFRLSEPAARLEHSIQTWKLIGSPAYPSTDEERLEFIQRNYVRGITGPGVQRQMLAILASPDRRPLLQKLKVPTLVLHGEDDPLVPLDGGIDTAKNIPEARLRTIKGMGHDLPKALLPELFSYVHEHIEAYSHV